MKKGSRTNHLWLLLSLLLLTFCLTGTSAAESKPGKDTGLKGGKIVARVNGEAIRETALAPYIKREMKKFRKYGGKRDTSALEGRLKQRALDEAIMKELIKQESRKMRVENIEEKVDEKLRELKKKYQDTKKYEGYLLSRGITEEDVKESLKNRIHIEEYLKKKGLRDPRVPEDEIRAYYKKNKESFRIKESLRASHILIMVKEDAGPEEKEKLRTKTESIRQELLKGRDFADAAKEYSEDGAASGGGDLGYINRGYMPPEFDTAAFSLEKGAISDIIRTKHGFHIIKVMDRQPEGIAPFEEVKDFIGKYLQEGLTRRNYVSHLKELKSKAEIEILIN